MQDIVGMLEGLRAHAERQQQSSTMAYDNLAVAVNRLAVAIESLAAAFRDKHHG